MNEGGDVFGQRRAFVLFLSVSALAAFVNVLARLILSHFTPFGVAVLVAYLIGMTVAFLLNRAFVFSQSGRNVRHEYARFALVNIIALGQVWIVSVGLAEWLFPRVGYTWNAQTIAHVIGVGSPVFTSYFGHKYFSFGPVRENAES